MQDASLPSWLKRDGEQENEQRSTRRRKGPGSSQDQMLELTTLMAQSHLQTDRQNRENSGCLKVTSLYFKSQQDTNWPAWVQEGLDAADTWFRKLREQQGDDTRDNGRLGSKGPGSPHVQVGTKTILAILNTEVLKKSEQQELRTRLINWWTTKLAMPGKTENEVAEEIQVFRVEGPPPTTRDTALKFEKSDDDMEEESKGTPFVKITYRLNSDAASGSQHLGCLSAGRSGPQ